MGWPIAPRFWSAETAPDRRFVVNAGQRASRKLQKHSSLLPSHVIFATFLAIGMGATVVVHSGLAVFQALLQSF